MLNSTHTETTRAATLSSDDIAAMRHIASIQAHNRTKAATEVFFRSQSKIQEWGRRVINLMPVGLTTHRVWMPTADSLSNLECRGLVTVKRSGSGQHIAVCSWFNVAGLTEKQMARPNRIAADRLMCAFVIQL